jgi:3-methyladenine DNA glycosylase/8-oxoguanine DNA glycosylase
MSSSATATRPSSIEWPLVGGGGEPIDLLRTITSHGIASLAPMFPDEAAGTLEFTVEAAPGKARTVRVEPGPRGRVRMTVVGAAPGHRAFERLVQMTRHVLRLDEDLSPFYAVAKKDPDLAWVTSGAGRMIRSPTVFEEIVKTVCTTNCAWGATVRMVNSLVEHLGAAAPGAPSSSTAGRAFPSPEAMATAGEPFYRDVVRAGYRGKYFVALAESVASGSLDVEAFGRASAAELPDDDLEQELLALPGVGPYAAAHIMMMLGRYSRLILDSWTRPKYARLRGRRSVKDSTVLRRWRPYGDYAGLAFWMYLTKDWVEE